jgi:SPP1 gp7 family putative phage head morphogenesis protein
MTSKEYWKGRSLLLEQLLHDRSEATAQRISRLYGLAQENIFQQIEKVFSSYAKGGALNEKKAMELLSVRETDEAERELRRQYEEATGPAKRDIWARLSAPAYANRISRLQALRDKLYTQARMMGLEEVSYVRDRLSDTLEQSYYRTTFDVQQFTGEGYRFDRLTDRQIKAALAADWNGKNWSERIWDNNQMFADAVEDTVTVGIMAGLRYDEMRDNLLHVIGLDDTEGARYRSARLVHTECAFVANQGHLMGYQAAEIEKYIFLATLDLRTSKICRALDGKRFLVSEAQAGTNLPPMHPWCRSTTMPDMSAEQLRKVPRAARDPETGKSVTVPGDITYQEWHEKFVDNNPEMQAAERMENNRSKDRTQWQEYKAILGKNAPKNLAAFQKMKYTEPEKWELVQLDYFRRNRLQKNPNLALPGADKVVAPEPKFTKYLFNPDNEKGWPKGQKFASSLGYDGDSWPALRDEIVRGATLYPASLKGETAYGMLYEQRMVLYGKKNHPANVVVGWIHRTTGETSMTTAYIKKVDKNEHS